MSHDGGVPRQIPSAGSLSTSTLPSRTASSFETTLGSPVPAAAAAASSYISHAALSTITNTVELSPSLCTAGLPAGGTIHFNDTFNLVLDEPVAFVAQCANQTIFNVTDNTGGNATVLDKDPFYASIGPQVYALATATIISYMLVILIFITPRTFYVGGPGGGAGSAGAGGGLRTLFPGGGGRNSSIIGIGRRPLLQKIAALTVAVSLTIATADTFRVAEHQYNSGYVISKVLVETVVDSLEIRITRVISDTFLWLAQVQTLIRLFPRHKEKVTIKWLGFGLVLCDTVFSILENFLNQSHKGSDRPPATRSTDAIPALSYLFEISISLIYASCVLYYALSKRRFAFWHTKMRNVCLVALLSVIAVIIPVVFFVLDLAQPNIATWGEYIRWVGAAAASVVVWEWVERIETLERDEKKDGILGREIFDGDEMLDLTPSEDGSDLGRSTLPSDREGKKSSRFWKNVRDLHVDIQPRFPMRKWKKGKPDVQEKPLSTVENAAVKSDKNHISRPQQAITPISRSDTNSAASTVYAIRYHDPFSPSPAIPENEPVNERRQPTPVNVPPAISDETTLTNNSTSTTMEQRKGSKVDSVEVMATGRQIWQGVANPFKRKRTEPPAEVAAQIAESNARRSPLDRPLNIRSRINAFTTAQRSKLGGRSQRNRTPLAVTFIPAQPRGSRADIDPESSGLNLPTEPAEQRRMTPEVNVQEAPTSPNLADLPVTVIPPPVRGGRTWSPDDMVDDTTHDEQVTPPAEERSTPNFLFDGHPAGDATGDRNNSPSVIHSQRGALTISESPGRVRDNHTPSNPTPSAIRRVRNSRSATITSISDRLGSASPAAMSGASGRRSAATDSSGPPRSGTADSAGQQGR